MDYLNSDENREEFIFLPNHRVHHEMITRAGNQESTEIMVWDLVHMYHSDGCDTMLRLNGIEYRIVSIRDNFMVWVVNGIFIYLRTACQFVERSSA